MMKKQNMRQFLPLAAGGVILAALVFASVIVFNVSHKISRDSSSSVKKLQLSMHSKTFDAARSRRGSDVISLEDVFISVKTSKKFHEERLGPILKTWFRLAQRQVQDY